MRSWERSRYVLGREEFLLGNKSSERCSKISLVLGTFKIPINICSYIDIWDDLLSLLNESLLHHRLTTSKKIWWEPSIFASHFGMIENVSNAQNYVVFEVFKVFRIAHRGVRLVADSTRRLKKKMLNSAQFLLQRVDCMQLVDKSSDLLLLSFLKGEVVCKLKCIW